MILTRFYWTVNSRANYRVFFWMLYDERQLKGCAVCREAIA
jgi:hypothetical protein